MSKIEALKAIENLNEIINHSDAIMLARGDLGVEIPYYEVPFYEKLVIEKCRA
jgi:pyruvate kinase